MLFAAIRKTAAAGIAGLAVKVRLHCATVPRFEMTDAIADGKNLYAQFMAWNSGVGEKGHLAQISAKVRSADAHALDAHQRLARERRRRFGNVDADPAKWFFELEGFHKVEL
ncbi:MAG: hypothetical protein DVB28_000748 [Verrucomicrobia bacterium]|nr:MAG: hypothetical protein DVB28_000748 [Verrucomicrobiota bacterium]